MRSDFVTFFGREKQSGLFADGRQSGGKSWSAFSVQDLAKVAEAELEDVLRRQGGIAVLVDQKLPDVAPVIRVGTWESAAYQPPTKLLILHVDSAPEWAALGNGITDIPVDVGNHVLLPFDRKAQRALENLRQGLESLPLDYEMTLLNVLRRPSLEWRVAQLERLAQGERATARGATTTGTGVLQETSTPRKKLIVAEVAAVILLIVISAFAGRLLFPPDTSRDAIQNQQKYATLVSISRTSPPLGAAQEEWIVSVRSNHAGPTPSGMITLLKDKRRFESRLDGSGVAVFPVPSSGPGHYELTAEYSGDSRFLGSTGVAEIEVPKPCPTPSRTVTQQTNQGQNSNRSASTPASTPLSGANQPPVVIRHVTTTTLRPNGPEKTVDATVTDTSDLSSYPVGRIVLKTEKDKTILKILTLFEGKASFSVHDIPKGRYKVFAEYLGDPWFVPSHSNAVDVHVK